MSETPLRPANKPASSSTTLQVKNTSGTALGLLNQRSNSAVHFVLQGKGGVGKTFVSSLLAQFLAWKGMDVQCFDIDPVNASLSEIAGLNVVCSPVFKEDSDEVDFHVLDSLINQVVEQPGTYVVDSGASSFKPVSTYLFEGGIFGTLTENGVQVYIHTIIATGPEIGQTIAGAETIIGGLKTHSDISVVLWVNEHHGPIESFTDGKTLQETPFYKDHSTKIAGLIEIPHQPRAMAENLSALLSRHMTFDKGLEGDVFFLVEKSRLKQFRTLMFKAIENAGIA